MSSCSLQYVTVANIFIFTVLRLDNSEPLDLNYGRGAYYNPALQMDNFQMTNIPSRYN